MREKIGKLTHERAPANDVVALNGLQYIDDKENTLAMKISTGIFSCCNREGYRLKNETSIYALQKSLPGQVFILRLKTPLNNLG